MKYYLIGGLGADERVFKFLSLDFTAEYINWIQPKKKESLESYSKRLCKSIDTNVPFSIIGVSFGGIVAVEMNKHVKPKHTFLISSVSSHIELPKAYLFLAKPVIGIMPLFLLKPPQFIMNFMFGAVNKVLLKRIIDDTSPEFIRWALKSIISWKGEMNHKDFTRIHGTKDNLIKLKGKAIKVDNGGHFMIVDRGEEISRIVNTVSKAP